MIVKVPILYQGIVDYFSLKVRGINGLKEIIRELNVDLIFRAFWKRWQELLVYYVLGGSANNALLVDKGMYKA